MLSIAKLQIDNSPRATSKQYVWQQQQRSHQKTDLTSLCVRCGHSGQRADWKRHNKIHYGSCYTQRMHYSKSTGKGLRLTGISQPARQSPTTATCTPLPPSLPPQPTNQPTKPTDRQSKNKKQSTTKTQLYGSSSAVLHSAETYYTPCPAQCSPRGRSTTRPDVHYPMCRSLSSLSSLSLSSLALSLHVMLTTIAAASASPALAAAA